MIQLQKIEETDRDILWNLLQKYLYEMTNFYDDPMDEHGNLPYGHFDDYFTDPARVAYFIYSGSDLAGFALLNPYSNLGQEPDFTMAEFTVFPPYRRKHLALDAAPYNPEVHQLEDDETVLVFEV